MQRKISKAEKARSLMYKRSMLADLNYNTIRDSLWDMSEACGDIHWAFDDDDTLYNFFDGNEDEAYEFKFSFSDLDAEIERLQSSFEEIFSFSDDPEKDFNDMTSTGWNSPERVARNGERWRELKCKTNL